MFQPISAIDYLVFDADKQILVCTLSSSKERSYLRKKWENRATAAFEFQKGDNILDLVRDLLANPQIRAIVFDGEGPARSVFDAFWQRTEEFGLQGIADNHADAVRQFVDLYDEDCGIRGPLQPFWPKRLRYAHPAEEPNRA